MKKIFKTGNYKITWRSQAHILSVMYSLTFSFYKLSETETCVMRRSLYDGKIRDYTGQDSAAVVGKKVTIGVLHNRASV